MGLVPASTSPRRRVCWPGFCATYPTLTGRAPRSAPSPHSRRASSAVARASASARWAQGRGMPRSAHAVGSFARVVRSVHKPAPMSTFTSLRWNSWHNIRESKGRLWATSTAPLRRRAKSAATSPKTGAASTIDALIPCTPVAPTSRSGLSRVSYSSTVSHESGSMATMAISMILSAQPKPVVSTSTTTVGRCDLGARCVWYTASSNVAC